MQLRLGTSRDASPSAVVALGWGDHAPPDATKLGRASAAALKRYVAERGGAPAAGTVWELTRLGEVPSLILLVGTGDGSARALRLAGAGTARALTSGHAKASTVQVYLGGLEVAPFAEGTQLAAYRFGAGTDAPNESLGTLSLYGSGSAEDLRQAEVAASSCCWARDLTNTRTNTKSPAWLGQQAAAQLAPLGVAVTLRDEAWLRAHGCGGILAVGGGSAAAPGLIEASWKPRGTAKGPHIVLVGKGITFDTGGYNLKPGASMTAMYTDMAGGGAVLGALRAVAMRRLAVRVTALVPAAENSVSGTAMRPSDVLRHYNGRTSEINNTDAEGRLVLADALAYAVDALSPTVLVDVATLTGAMKMALGERIGGLLATDDALASSLIASGAAVDEPLWRMPLHRDYERLLDSPVADATNAPGPPGAITAGLFLQHFTGGLPWAHLDIAGPARASEPDGFLTRGATGFGTRLLAHWIQAQI